VADRTPQRLTLEIAEHAGSIAGRMSDEGGVSIEFGGWVGLAGAIERFLGGDATRPELPGEERPG
jgi:hypothetical protein